MRPFTSATRVHHQCRRDTVIVPSQTCPRGGTTGWPGEPEIPFHDGVGMTIEWCVRNRDRDEIQRKLETMPTEQ